MFLAALLDRAMQGATPLAGYLESALRLSATEPNIRVQQQISSSIVTTTDLMQRLRPETDEALAAWLPVLEEQSLRLAAADTAADLKRSWFNAFLGVTATQQGLLAVRELLDGTRDIPGLPITADLRWALLIKLAAHGTPDIDALIAAERASDDSDFGVKSALTASAARPDGAQKNAWLAELQSPEALGGLARQRAVMAGLFPANQTQLQFELLDEVLQSLPALSHTVDPYFMSSYVRSLLQPTCLPASVARMQDTLDQQIARLDSTAVRFLREAHQADAECLELRSSQH
jgi:aminopeptidase N